MVRQAAYVPHWYCWLVTLHTESFRQPVRRRRADGPAVVKLPR